MRQVQNGEGHEILEKLIYVILGVAGKRSYSVVFDLVAPK